MSRILITGGSGSFGQAFTKYILDNYQDEVCIYSRDEAKQYKLRQQFDSERTRWFIGDIRDKERLTRAMEGVTDVVHAAALKRVEVGEENPTEMVKTNVIGAMNIIEAAHDAGVAKVVTLSTDKATNPCNCYGASKLMVEKLMIAANNMSGKNGPRFSVTRYGNVAGSTGSVIPIWRNLIKEYGAHTVPVTNPCMTRFWMHMGEAVELVLYTLREMQGGEIVVPSLPAYELGDLAKAMGKESRVMGVRPGEKLHEAMIGPDEAHEFSRVGKYWVSFPGETAASEVRKSAFTSDIARRMSVDELREKLKHV